MPYQVEHVNTEGEQMKWPLRGNRCVQTSSSPSTNLTIKYICRVGHFCGIAYSSSIGRMKIREIAVESELDVFGDCYFTAVQIAEMKFIRYP